MRRCCTWLLLAITSLHFLGGHFCYRITYSVEVNYRMDAAEASLAEALAAETGIEPNIKILQDYEVEAVGGGYSGVFVFSKEVNGERVHYIVDPYGTETVDQEYFVGRRPEPGGQTETVILLQRLFSPFIMQEVLSFSPHETTEFALRNFGFPAWRDLFAVSIPAPPPRTA